MEKGSDLVKNTLILAFGAVFTKFIGFFLLPLYTHYLSPSEYGYVDVITVILTLLIPALTLQLSMALFRYLISARGKHEELTEVISNVFAMTFVLIIPWLLLAIVLGALVEIKHFPYIILTGLSMLLSQHAFQIARGFGKNDQFTIASILTGFTTLLGAFFFIVWLQLGATGMLLSIACAHLIAVLYLFLKLKLHLYLTTKCFDTNLWKEILGYSTPLVPNGLAWWLNNAASRVLITFLIDTTANGIFAVATKFSGILTSLFSVFSMSWTESATLHIDEPDRDSFFSKVANSSIRIFGSLAITLIAAMPFAFPIMVDQTFKSAYNYIPLLIVGVFLNVVVGFYSAIYVAKKLTVKVMNTTLIGSITNIVLSFCLIPFLGLYGAALATTLSFLTLSVVRHFDVKKYVTITYRKRTFLILFISFLIVSMTYYSNVLWLHLASLGFSAIIFCFLNYSQLKILIRKVLSRLGTSR